MKYSTSDLAARTVERRAAEAVVWGMPAVNYDLMRQAMLDTTEAKENEVVYWSRPVDWRNQTLTPNPDALYFMTFFNTKDVGSVVIEVPPADEGGSITANIDDIWQMPLEDAGPAGADKGKGGRYLILPPGSRSAAPGGYMPLPSHTFGGYALIRSNLAGSSDADIAKAVAYGKRLKVYPLAQAANPPPTKFTDATGVVFDSTIPYDLRYFQSLDRIIQTEPWLERDKAMIDSLRSIGIEKGKAFNPDEKAKATFDEAAHEAHDWLDHLYETALPRYFDQAHWAVPALPEVVEANSTGYADPKQLSDRRTRCHLFGRLHRYQTPRRRPVLSDDQHGQGWSATYGLEFLLCDRAGQSSGELILVGDGLRPGDTCAHSRHVDGKPVVSQRATEQRRIG